jgi:hypothetical protein
VRPIFGSRVRVGAPALGGCHSSRNHLLVGGFGRRKATHFYAVKVRGDGNSREWTRQYGFGRGGFAGRCRLDRRGRRATSVLVSPRARRAPRIGPRQGGRRRPGQASARPRQEVAENVLQRRPFERIAFCGEQRARTRGSPPKPAEIRTECLGGLEVERQFEFRHEMIPARGPHGEDHKSLQPQRRR